MEGSSGSPATACCRADLSLCEGKSTGGPRRTLALLEGARPSSSISSRTILRTFLPFLQSPSLVFQYTCTATKYKVINVRQISRQLSKKGCRLCQTTPTVAVLSLVLSATVATPVEGWPTVDSTWVWVVCLQPAKRDILPSFLSAPHPIFFNMRLSAVLEDRPGSRSVRMGVVVCPWGCFGSQRRFAICLELPVERDHFNFPSLAWPTFVPLCSCFSVFSALILNSCHAQPLFISAHTPPIPPSQ